MQSHLIEVLIKSGRPFCKTKSWSGSCAKTRKHRLSSPNTTVATLRTKLPPPFNPPLPGASTPEEGANHSWLALWLDGETCPVPPAESVLIALHKKAGGPLALNLAHLSIFARRWTKANSGEQIHAGQTELPVFSRLRASTHYKNNQSVCVGIHTFTALDFVQYL